MTDCIFCRIISREIDAKRVYEDEHTLAFLDINPANKGHTLIVSKYHAPTLFDIPEEELRSTISTVRKVAIAIRDSIKPQGINIVQSNGKAAGQEIDHLHFHVVPRTFEDGNMLKFNRIQVSDEDQKKTAKLIKESVHTPQVKKENKVDTTLDRIDINLKDLDDVLK